MSTEDKIAQNFRSNVHKLEQMPPDMVWVRIQRQLEERKRQKKRIYLYRYVAVAASVVAIVSVMALYYVMDVRQNEIRLAEERVEDQELLLPDTGSKADKALTLGTQDKSIPPAPPSESKKSNSPSPSAEPTQTAVKEDAPNLLAILDALKNDDINAESDMGLNEGVTASPIMDKQQVEEFNAVAAQGEEPERDQTAPAVAAKRPEADANRPQKASKEKVSPTAPAAKPQSPGAPRPYEETKGVAAQFENAKDAESAIPSQNLGDKKPNARINNPLTFFNWLPGRWEDTYNRDAFEIWIRKDAFTLVGEAYIRSNAVDILTEKMQLDVFGEQLYFTTYLPDGQLIGRYVFKKYRKNDAVFEQNSDAALPREVVISFKNERYTLSYENTGRANLENLNMTNMNNMRMRNNLNLNEGGERNLRRAN